MTKPSKPSIPENEHQRLRALYNLHLLDTVAEDRFDRIVRVIKSVFHVPIVWVSLVDKEREWLKSRYGLNVREMPRDISFGAHTILQKDCLIVNNTLDDIRFKDNPLVLREPQVRFYLGYPLKIQGEFNIGTLSLMDHKPLEFNAVDLNIIHDLATTTEAELDIEHLSTDDLLTNLPNRQGFLVRAKKMIKRCKQYDKNIILLYFDMHSLNAINSDYGFEEGDKILQTFSDYLRHNFRVSDLVARIGGDKFCVLCPGMEKRHVSNVIQRLQKKLTQINVPIPIDFHMGMIEYDYVFHFSVGSLLEHIDKEIYHYKRVHQHTYAYAHNE